ncbi:MAG TPA: sodium/proton antiporter NhaB [Gammaproteobacteria bacterium]|nr:sodium/proton antiporter NhaB [Gammaproteobacteria bacterium]
MSQAGAPSLAHAFAARFLGSVPGWYKAAILGFLVLNPVLYALNPYVAGWALVLEFIATLALALRCYPLQPGGLLALEAVLIGMTTPGRVYEETVAGVEVILLLIFMVAGIYFLKELLLFVFTKLVVRVRSKLALSLLFCLSAAVMSAFLDALTVIAVVIAVAAGFYGVYHRVASGKRVDDEHHDAAVDEHVHELKRADLDEFRAFLRSLVMHAAVGTALGGVATLVGEPQNLLIGSVAGWSFGEFFVRIAPVSVPVLAAGLATCALVEEFRWFGYGARLPAPVREVLEEFDRLGDARRTAADRAVLLVQAAVAAFLVVALAFHWAAVGLIGLAVIVLATAFTGVTEEHRLGRAFTEALPFTALLVVFFAIVAVIQDQALFGPVIRYVLALPAHEQPGAFFVANGILSAISDNVFVATVYISQVAAALADGRIDRAQFDALAVAVNTGTNIPSVATPNGQAAFLFLLTSALAPLIRLSYWRMTVMALPYTVVLTATGLLAVELWI